MNCRAILQPPYPSHMSSNFRQKVLSGLFWSLLQGWGVRFGGLAIFMVLARLLDPHDVGLFAAAATVIGFCAMFVESGLSEAIIQRREVTNPQLNSAFVVNMGLALLAVVAIWLSADWICAYMRMPELLWILRVSALGTLVTAATFSQQAIYRREFKYKLLTTVSFMATLGSGVAALGLAWSGAGVWALVAQAIVMAVITAVVLWWKSDWRFSPEFDFAGMKQLLDYGLKRLFSTVMDFLNTRFVELFCAASLGAAGLGVYAVGVRLYQAMMQSLCFAMLEIAHNAFSRLAHDREALVSAYYKAMATSAAVAVPVFCLSAALSPELTVVIFGARWSAAAEVMNLMLLLGAVQVLQFYNVIAYNALGRPGIGLAFMVIKTVITLSAMIWARNESLHVIVVTYVLSQLSVTPLSFAVARRILEISMRRLAVHTGGFVLAATAAYAVVWFSRAHVAEALPAALPRLVVLSALGGLSYLALVAILARRQAMEVIVLFKNRKG